MPILPDCLPERLFQFILLLPAHFSWILTKVLLLLTITTPPAKNPQTEMLHSADNVIFPPNDIPMNPENHSWQCCSYYPQMGTA